VRPEVEECLDDVLIAQIIGKRCAHTHEQIKSLSKSKVSHIPDAILAVGVFCSGRRDEARIEVDANYPCAALSQ
jgi:hypothetical protein